MSVEPYRGELEQFDPYWLERMYAEWEEHEQYVEWDEETFAEDQPGCGCPFCLCSNSTFAGETCNECLAGSHQG